MSEKKRWIGIDPGREGALAIIDSDGGVEVFDHPGNEYALADLCFEIALGPIPIAGVVIEEVHAMPKNGSIACFKLGDNFGAWKMLMAICRWPVRFIKPSAWKKGLGFPKGDYSASKSHSVALACRLYPMHASLFHGPKGGKKDGRAEAVLLAHLATGRAFGA